MATGVNGYVMQRAFRLAMIAGMALVCAPRTVAADDALKCEAYKNKLAGKYYQCRENAEAKAIIKGIPADFSRCVMKFEEKWGRAEERGEGMCPDNVLPAAMNAFITGQAAETAAIIAGAMDVPTCGDGVVNVAGEQCDTSDTGGETCASLGFVGGELQCNGACKFATGSCVLAPSTCGNGISEPGEVCDGADLNGKTCASASLSAPYGTLSCNDTCSALVTTACQPRFVANEWTVSDNATNLMWEKKGNFSVNVTYQWSATGVAPDGELFFDRLLIMNGGSTLGSAQMIDGEIVSCPTAPTGHCDWRLPTVVELQTILAPCTGGPCIDPIFGLTKSDLYWTASTVRGSLDFAWKVDFGTGGVSISPKSFALYARLVRNMP